MLSPGVAALIAHLAFWLLVAYGWFWDEIGPTGILVMVVLWVAGWFGLPHLRYGAALFPSYVAALDVALVFLVFKGDVRLS